MRLHLLTTFITTCKETAATTVGEHVGLGKCFHRWTKFGILIFCFCISKCYTFSVRYDVEQVYSVRLVYTLRAYLPFLTRLDGLLDSMNYPGW